MQLTREYFRAIIFYNFRRGLSLRLAIKHHPCGRRSLKDEIREGPPKTAVTKNQTTPNVTSYSSLKL